MTLPPVHHCPAYYAVRCVWRSRVEIAKWVFALVFLVFFALGVASCVQSFFP